MNISICRGLQVLQPVVHFNEILQAVMPLASFHTEAGEASLSLDSAKVEAQTLQEPCPMLKQAQAIIADLAM